MSRWDEIIEKCPLLFRYHCNFECGLGWFDILDELCMKIEEIIRTQQNVPEGEDCFSTYMYVDQIKEKFGTLRFYMSSATSNIYKLIDEAEVKSSVTCESCGAPGKLGNEKWKTVSCDKCKEKSCLGSRK